MSLTNNAYLNLVPNIKFTNYDSKQYLLHDLIKNHVALINFFYCNCEKKCIPIGKNLCKVNKIIGKDNLNNYKIVMISISFDPINDTINDINEYKNIIGANNCTNWYFLKGDPQDTELLRKKIGMYEIDYESDLFKQNHSGSLLILQEKLNRNSMASGFENILNIVRKILSLVPPYAYRNTGHSLLKTIDFCNFTKDEKLSFFNNLETISSVYTTSYLPDDMLEIFYEISNKMAKCGFQEKFTYEKKDGTTFQSKTDNELETIKDNIKTLVINSEPIKKSCCCNNKLT